MPSAAAAFAAPHLEDASASSRPTTPFSKMFFKSPAAVLKRGASSSSSSKQQRTTKLAQPRPHTVSGSQLPMHLSSYVSYCAYSSLWDPSVYGAGNPCPPPPRGTLNDSKLAFLDWRMAVIKFERESASSRIRSASQPRATHAAAAPTESLEEVLDVIVGHMTDARDHMDHENALSGRIQELEVDDDVLVRNRKPVQRVSGFAPRPHTSEGIAPTYVPKMPGRFYHVAAEHIEPVVIAPAPQAAAQPTVRPVLDSIPPSAMAKAVILSVHGEDLDGDSAVSTPASTSDSASVSGSNMGSYEGSQWRSSSTFSHRRHRASSSVNPAQALDSSDRRSHRSHRPNNSVEHAITLADLDQSARLLEARLAAEAGAVHAGEADPRVHLVKTAHSHRNKPLPVPAGQHFFASVPFEHLAPVRESSFTTPQIGQDQQKTPSTVAPDRFGSDEQQQQRPQHEDSNDESLAPVRRITPRRSKSLLSRAVSRFRPSTPSSSNTAPAAESENAADNNTTTTTIDAPAARPSSRLGLFGRQSTRIRSRSVGAATALSSRAGSDIGHTNNADYLAESSRRVPVPKIPAQHQQQQQQQQQQQPQALCNRESLDEGASSSSRPSSRMASVLSLRPGLRRPSLPGSNPPSSASAHAARMLNEASRPAAVPNAYIGSEQDEQDQQEVAEAVRPVSSLSMLRSRTPNPFKSSKNWLRLRHKQADSFSHSPAGSTVVSAA